MAKLTIILVLVALAYIVKAEEYVEDKPDDIAGAGSSDEYTIPLGVEAEGAGDEVPTAGGIQNQDLLPVEGSPLDMTMPFIVTPISPDDIMNMRSDPRTNTVVSGVSSSKSSSMKMVNGVLVEDNKSEKTVVNDGQNVTVTESES